MYSHVVFTGGGLGGMTCLGVLRYMQEHGLVKAVREVSGTSMGAFFACMLAMNVLAGELEEYLKGYFAKEENTSFTLMNSLLSILEDYGMDDGQRLVQPLRHFVEDKYGWKKDTITLREFVQKTGVNVVICAANIGTRKPVYFSTDTTPDVCLYDAVQASMSLPVLMKPVKINDELYVDGGICDNIPIAGFPKSGQNRTLVVNCAQIIPNDMPSDTFVRYISILMCMMMYNANMMRVSQQHDMLHLEKSPIPFMRVETYDDGTLRILLTEEELDMAIAYGYTEMYKFIKNKDQNQKA